MKTIRHIYFILMAFIFILGVLIIFANVRLNRLTDETYLINTQHQEQIILLNKLNQTTYKLNLFARNYSVTRDKKWRFLYEDSKKSHNKYLSLSKDYKFNYPIQISNYYIGINKSQETTNARQLKGAELNLSLATLLSKTIDLSLLLINQQEIAIDIAQDLKGHSNEMQSTKTHLKQAQEILFDYEYIQGFNNTIALIDNIHKIINDNKKHTIDKLEHEKKVIENIVLVMAFIIILIVIKTTTLLWTHILKPIDNIKRILNRKIKDKEFEFRITLDNQGELEDLVKAQNKILNNISDKFEFNRQIKSFCDLIKSCSEIKILAKEVSMFISATFDFPYTAMYTKKNNTFILISSVGIDENKIDDSSFHFHQSIIKTKQPLKITNEDDEFNLFQAVKLLQLSEIHFIPLFVNNEIVGILEIGSIKKLNGQEINWLSQIKEELAISIQSTTNIELQQKVEIKIAEQLKLNKQIINAIPNPTYFRDIEGRYIGVNDAFTDFLGLFYADVIDKFPSELFPENVAFLFQEKEKKLLKNPNSDIYNIELKNFKDEIRSITVYEATYFDANGLPLGIVGLFVDVTTHKRLESDLIAAKDEATKASKAKGEFLANMSHEIRTPMNAILGMSHLALLTDLNDKQKNYISNIDKAGKSLLGIINDILDFSKIEAGKFTIENIEFSFSEVLDNVTNIISIKADDKKLKLIFDIDPSLPNDLIGDPLKLGQIIINLVGNAIKFTEFGEIIIRVRKKNEHNNIIDIQFDIEDSGIGMNDEQINRLFQSFSQADNSITRKYGGTGLGLTICKNFIELMNGHIWVESELGKGSIFSFIIQCQRGKLVVSEKMNQASLLNNKRAIVVDDNQVSREIMYSLLVKLNLQVRVVSSGEEAIREVKNANFSNDNFDLIFIDCKVNGICQDETILQIKDLKLRYDPKIIFVNDYGEDARLFVNDKDKLFDLSLIKPINSSSLSEKLIKLFEPKEVNLGKENIKEMNNQDNVDFSDFNILIVEDNIINQEVAKGVLEQFKPNLYMANNGKIAIDIILHHPIDIVLMDMQMPEMDGITATKIIRETHSLFNLPIVAMTANAMKQDIDQCIAAGMNDHLAKPIDVLKMIETIIHWTSSKHKEKASKIRIKRKIDNINLKSIDIDPLILDINEGIYRTGGNSETYWKVIKSLTQSKLILIDKMKEHIRQQNFEEIKFFAHSLKGAAANVSASSLSLISEKLEKQADNKINMDICFLDKINDYLIEINSYIPKQKITDKNNGNKNEFIGYTLKEFKIELEQLNILLSRFDTQAIDFILGIKENAKNMNINLNEIESLIYEYEYEDAVKILNSLLKKLDNNIEDKSMIYL